MTPRPRVARPTVSGAAPRSLGSPRAELFALAFAAEAFAACSPSVPRADFRAPENAAEHLDAPHVVLVSFDGFGAELWGRHPQPTLDRVAAQGAVAERMIPAYPPKTFSSHYTIATGMYADRHGIVGNRFWAPDLGLAYSLSDRAAVEDGRFYRGEPIWVTAERQGMVAASFFFVGSEAPVGGVRPSYWHPFDPDVPHERRVDQVLEWLAMPPETRPRMITLYFEDVDAVGHFDEPGSPAVAAAVARVDASVARLLAGIEALPHAEEVYLILVSDHGLMFAPSHAVDRLDMTRFPGVRLVETGPYASLFVDEGGPVRARAIRDSLRAMLPLDSVWLREEVPERLHYRADPRVGDIVAMAAPGRRILELGQVARDTYNHGWDNALPEMAAIFVAMGPGIPAGQRIPPFEAVHVYPFLAHLLGLEPNADVDGRLEVLQSILDP